MGSLPPSKPPPARHRPGARSARREVFLPLYRRPCQKGESVMSIHSWLRSFRATTIPQPVRRPRPLGPLGVEPLEGRDLMSATLSIADAWVMEGDSGPTYATFIVRLSEPSAGAVTVNYATADGTAKDNGDYERTSGTLTFAPGETEKRITIAVQGDTHAENDEY